MSETQLFFDAIRAGDLAAVRTLLDQDAALLNGKNAQSQSPVLFSIYNRQKEIRDFLVSHGAVLELHEAAALDTWARVKGTPRERRGSCQELFADAFRLWRSLRCLEISKSPNIYMRKAQI